MTGPPNNFQKLWVTITTTITRSGWFHYREPSPPPIQTNRQTPRQLPRRATTTSRATAPRDSNPLSAGTKATTPTKDFFKYFLFPLVLLLGLTFAGRAVSTSTSNNVDLFSYIAYKFDYYVLRGDYAKKPQPKPPHAEPYEPYIVPGIAGLSFIFCLALWKIIPFREGLLEALNRPSVFTYGDVVVTYQSPSVWKWLLIPDTDKELTRILTANPHVDLRKHEAALGVKIIDVQRSTKKSGFIGWTGSPK